MVGTAEHEALKTRVFISYSRKDTDFVWQLRRALEERVFDAFIDTEQISGGEEWKRRIDQLILSADAVVFVVSPDSIASSVCDWEVGRAIGLSKRLIPVVWRGIQDGEAPSALSARNYIFCTTEADFSRAVDQLVHACETDIDWVREHTRLVELASRWTLGGQKRDLLLRGGELAEALAWREKRNRSAPEIPDALARLLSESTLDRRRTARRSLFIGVTITALLVSLVAGYAYTQRAALQQRYVAATRFSPYVHTIESVSTLPPGATFQDCRASSADCPTMVVIASGTFRMGSPGSGEAGVDASSVSFPAIGRVYSPDTIGGALDEMPMRTVSVSRFAVSATEITYAQWKSCVDMGGCRSQPNPIDQHYPVEGEERDARPAINLSWTDAREYTRWLSEMTSEEYRLLTEAEWEFAARATTLDTQPTRFSWGNQDPACERGAINGAAFGYSGGLASEMSSGGCDEIMSSRVASFQPNAFGLYDMHGNVWEWVEDCYRDRYDTDDTDSAAFQAHDRPCELRILRGGSWNNSADYLRSAYRLQSPALTRNRQSGFRVARSIQ